MRTPIVDFVKEYHAKEVSRFHMPGHKGCSFLYAKEAGPIEAFDITEIKGADSLYEAEGIISESERNATKLFGTGKTIYSTEGSSQCIRAMLYLALSVRKGEGRPYVIAARNAHKTLLYTAALLDFDIVWLWPKEMHSLLSCETDFNEIDRILKERKEKPAAIYVTSPDYLGGQHDIKALADYCHERKLFLLVDNAHGAYHHFTEEKLHPMDLGADLCCDSAHKTLPVLTGGAYLHMSRSFAEKYGSYSKQAMSLFGSTSPSYLIMASLDQCNRYLENQITEEIRMIRTEIEDCKNVLSQNGWKVEKTEPLKITVRCPKEYNGLFMAERLRKEGVECEYADKDYVVLMVSPQNQKEDFMRVIRGFGKREGMYTRNPELLMTRPLQKMTIRQAVMSPQETMAVKHSLGKICGAPTVGCPPAVPILVSGEVIDEDAIRLFEYYKINEVDVVKEVQ